MNTVDRVLSYDEACGRAGIVRRTLERLIAAGEGPAIVKVSTRRRGIFESDLDRWLRGRRCGAAGEPTCSEPPRKRGRPRKTEQSDAAA